jgi:hypothetical protein
MQIKQLWPFFADERLGLGRRDLKKNRPALAIYQV